MKTAMIHARIEPKLKKKAEGILAQLGLEPSELIRMLYAQVVKFKGVPFPVRIPNAESRAVIRDIAAGRNIKRFDSAEEMLANLKS
jgi:DNA-damage-inducible protein J